MNTISMPLRIGDSVRQMYRRTVLDSFRIIRDHGWRGLWRQRGWKFFAAIVAAYLVRDVVLYLLLPIWLAHRLF